VAQVFGTLNRRDRESRLWAHGLHQDQEFIQRGNFFLVAESLLVVAYSGILTKGLAAGADGHAFKLLLSARVISVFGLLLSIVWIYVSNFERKTVEYLMKRARRLIPDYQDVFEERPRSKISTNWLMTFMVPALAGIMWAFLLRSRISFPTV
jgi:hypothetical protein